MDTPQEFAKRKGFTAAPPGTTSYYIMFMMMRMYAKYYHEQQVNSVDLADVGETFDEYTTQVGMNRCSSCGSSYCDGDICT